jgi:hypothetical protein
MSSEWFQNWCFIAIFGGFLQELHLEAPPFELAFDQEGSGFKKSSQWIKRHF